MKLRTLTILWIVVAVASCPPALGTYWDVEPVYSGGFASGDVSLAVDSAGVPSISYTASGILYLAVKGQVGWSHQVIAQPGFWGGFSSHAYSNSWQPAVAYIDASSPMVNYLKYAVKVAGNWVVETVDDVGGFADYVSLAFNSSGQACIAYCQTTGTYPDLVTYVRFARRIGPNNWVKQSIAQVPFATGPAMAIEDDTYCVVFIDSDSGQLRLAQRVGDGPWQITVLDGGAASPVVWYPYMALQPNGKPAVAYFLSSGGSMLLKYARQSDSTWTSETAVTLPSGTSYHCALAVTPGGIPLIGYYDTELECLGNAWKLGGQWHKETIDAANQSGFRPCSALDALGNIDAAYFDNMNGSVKFAWAPVPISVREAKLLQDGQICQISGLVASSAGGEIGNRIYVQDQARSSGIQLYLPGEVPAVTRGMLLDIQGQMTTIDEERAVLDPFLVEMAVVGEPKALFTRTDNLGGGDLLRSIEPKSVAQRGVENGVGLNNIGLLMRSSGIVTSIGGAHFHMDDGSGQTVKVSIPDGADPPAEGSYVGVTGISSCDPDGSTLIRLLRVRDGDDVQTLDAPE